MTKFGHTLKDSLGLWDKIMRIFVLLVAIFFSFNCSAAQLTSFSGAWSYLSEKNKSERWIVISSNAKEGFFQCENLDNAVRCAIPVWTKELPKRSQRVLPVGDREHPYPEIKGSQLKEFLSQDKVKKAKAILKRYGLDPFYVYSQVQAESGQIVGTQCDLRVMLNFKFKNFEMLSKDYLRELFNITEEDGYLFKAGS